MCVHALHTVHAVPDLRVAGGRLGDVILSSTDVRDVAAQRSSDNKLLPMTTGW